ncbi:MAG: acetate--CoA ligase [Phycisphaerales bacterium]|nr:acetate--CoA ligase [Phycisphaerae bacterium]NNM26444.1 acetate--CoA ligase [Phycisphaerales bacterium]
MSDATAIESVLHENRVFDPPAAFARRAGHVHVPSMEAYHARHRRSIEDPEGFWSEAAEAFDWFTPFSKVLEWKLPDAKWFLGGTTNICHNCVDRQVDAGYGDDVAIIWEGEPMPGGRPEVRRLTYRELQAEVSRFANVLKGLGVERGDIVTIYMGMVPELAIAMLACARIGAPHSIIFGGFSAQAIADRVTDAQSRTLVTADGAWRRGKVVPLKGNVDAAIEMAGIVENVVVLKRTETAIGWTDGRDHWWHELTASASEECPCEAMDSEDMLFLLYTSGSTGKPKGIMHTTGGYMVYTALTAREVFNLVPDRDQVYWCTADIGWVTGHSYIVYGILPNRVPTLMYEGAPNHPEPDRFWDIVERHKVTQFYTAPTAIRAFMKWGDEHPRKHDLSSLQVLGTVGEPINPEAWIWYHETIGSKQCPIVDTWWQTETGGQLLTPLPGATPTVPGSCTLPFFGIDAAIVNEQGEEQPANTGGLLAIRQPWPSMLRGIYGDRPRFIDTYFSRIPGMYFAGDGARRDERGYFWIMGRVDDVINVSGHRLGTMEVESALVSHDAVVEAAVVGIPHEIKGTGIAAFCTLEPQHQPADEAATEALRATLSAHVGREIGPIARPDLIRFTDALPKTRSGKIMRRLLRDIAAGEDNPQDMSTLEDQSVLAQLRGT